jgi:hypothetical protein
MHSAPAIMSDPTQLRAIVSLRRDGWTPEEIRRFLRISERTWRRRMAEIRRLEASAQASRN